MDTFRIAIAEDTENARFQLQQYLDRFARESGCSFDVEIYPDGREIVEHYRPGFDILLMDIEMPQLDGMKAARILREKDPDVAIVFVTNLVQYAVQGYEVEALDFIVKPLSWETFDFRMKRILGRLRRNRAEAREGVTLNPEGGMVLLPFADITYVEINHHTLTWHTLRSSYEVRGTISDAERQLEGHGFCRSNQCYLINLRFVTGIREEEVLLGGEALRISRSRKKDLMRAITEYNAGR